MTSPKGYEAIQASLGSDSVQQIKINFDKHQKNQTKKEPDKTLNSLITMRESIGASMGASIGDSMVNIPLDGVFTRQ